MRGSWMTVLSLVALPVLLSAQDFPNPEFRDAAIIPIFNRRTRKLSTFNFLQRRVGRATHPLAGSWRRSQTGMDPAGLPMRSFWWTEETCLGLFLMETADPSQVCNWQ